MCMLMPRLSSLIAVVPIAILLTAIFFVIFTIGKTEKKGLKAFGYVVVGFLGLAILIVFSGAIYGMARNDTARKYRMLQKMGMHQKMTALPQMMPQDKMSGMAMPGKNKVVQEKK